MWWGLLWDQTQPRLVTSWIFLQSKFQTFCCAPYTYVCHVSLGKERDIWVDYWQVMLRFDPNLTKQLRNSLIIGQKSLVLYQNDIPQVLSYIFSLHVLVCWIMFWEWMGKTLLSHFWVPKVWEISTHSESTQDNW